MSINIQNENIIVKPYTFSVSLKILNGKHNIKIYITKKKHLDKNRHFTWSLSLLRLISIKIKIENNKQDNKTKI